MAEEKENKKRVYPNQFCHKSCDILETAPDRCAECIEAQKAFELLLYEIEILEETIDYSPSEIKAINNKMSLTECPNCGAPYEKGKKCPYCDMPYPNSENMLEISESKIDRVNQYHDKIEETWDKMTDIYAFRSKVAREHETLKSFIAVGNFMDKIGLNKKKRMHQSHQEIKEGADHYNVSISLYISGVAKGEYSTPRGLYWSEIGTQIAVNSINNAINESNRPAPTQRINYSNNVSTGGSTSTSSGSSDALTEYMKRRAEMSTPKYYQPSRPCAECVYYYDGDKCANGQHTSGANDHCGLWKMK